MGSLRLFSQAQIHLRVNCGYASVWTPLLKELGGVRLASAELSCNRMVFSAADEARLDRCTIEQLTLRFSGPAQRLQHEPPAYQ